MKLKFIKLFLVQFLIVSCFSVLAQKSKPNPVSKNNYPNSFQINKEEFDNILSKKSKENIKSKNNKYIDKSTVITNVLNGDTKFVRVKLNYFTKAFLSIQVNGVYSTQIFILSDDKSVFYKGKIENGNVTMTKCNEDDIVSE